MAPKRFGFWMLFLWIHKAVVEKDCGNSTGIFGEDVELRCCYNTTDPELHHFRIQWQRKGIAECVVAAHLPDRNPPRVCERFKNRIARFEENRLRPLLLNISWEDEGMYQCILQGKKDNEYNVIFQGKIELIVSAVYPQPVITGPVKSGQNMVFTCNSSSGSSETRVYWRNQTDNSFLNSSDTTRIKQHNGTFIVSSILSIQAASSIKLECIIENKQLNRRFSTTYDLPTPTLLTTDNQHKISMIVGSLVTIMIVAILLLIWYKKKQPSHTLYDAADRSEI